MPDTDRRAQFVATHTANNGSTTTTDKEGNIILTSYVEPDDVPYSSRDDD